VRARIVREVRTSPDAVTVVVTPTYSGCPATEAIATCIRNALMQAGVARVEIETRLSPPGRPIGSLPRAREAAGLRIVPQAQLHRANHARCASPRGSLARAAAHGTPNGCRSSAPRRARRCIAASTAASLSSTSSDLRQPHLPHLPQRTRRTQRNAEREWSASPGTELWATMIELALKQRAASSAPHPEEYLGSVVYVSGFLRVLCVLCG